MHCALVIYTHRYKSGVEINGTKDRMEVKQKDSNIRVYFSYWLGVNKQLINLLSVN